jgi:formate hydrogenlyase subunit 3/multisubunit Na+/H+ antiporter MnhD subunit
VTFSQPPQNGRWSGRWRERWAARPAPARIAIATITVLAALVIVLGIAVWIAVPGLGEIRQAAGTDHVTTTFDAYDSRLA